MILLRFANTMVEPRRLNSATSWIVKKKKNTLVSNALAVQHKNSRRKNEIPGVRAGRIKFLKIPKNNIVFLVK